MIWTIIEQYWKVLFPKKICKKIYSALIAPLLLLFFFFCPKTKFCIWVLSFSVSHVSLPNHVKQPTSPMKGKYIIFPRNKKSMETPTKHLLKRQSYFLYVILKLQKSSNISLTTEQTTMIQHTHYGEQWYDYSTHTKKNW